MLVLTRRAGEQIVISNNIVITIVDIGNGKIKIGIDAPPGVCVNREEVQTAIDAGLAKKPPEKIQRRPRI